MIFVLVSDVMKMFVVECMFWLMIIDIIIREFFNVLKKIVNMFVMDNFMMVFKLVLLLLFEF